MKDRKGKNISRRDFLQDLGRSSEHALLTNLADRRFNSGTGITPSKFSQRPGEPPPSAQAFILDVQEFCLTEIFDHCRVPVEKKGIRHRSVVRQDSTRLPVERRGEAKILLERELSADDEMWEWLEMTQTNTNNKFDASLLALDEIGCVIDQWNLYGCRPVEVYATLNHSNLASPGLLVQERTVLVFEYAERVDESI